MTTGFSPAYGCWYFDCIWGCHEYDFESDSEAREAFLKHVCTGAGIVSEPPC